MFPKCRNHYNGNCRLTFHKCKEIPCKYPKGDLRDKVGAGIALDKKREKRYAELFEVEYSISFMEFQAVIGNKGTLYRDYYDQNSHKPVVTLRQRESLEKVVASMKTLGILPSDLSTRFRDVLDHSGVSMKMYSLVEGKVSKFYREGLYC